jgi:hypothetical protein
MKTVIKKSFIFAILVATLTLGDRFFFRTQDFLSDVGGLSAFVTVFGTLYGIMAAFIVFEVWNQYNNTVKLIEEEAAGLERMYRLVLYLNDKPVEEAMKKAIFRYAELVIEGKFRLLGEGERNIKAGKAFRDIFKVIMGVQFDDPRDSAVFPLIVEEGSHLAQTRTARITQSLARLPRILKFFFYFSSLCVIATFVIMPFSQVFYQIFTAAVVSFLLGLVVQLVEDLDNPFVGHFNLTPESFGRALKHIEEDY